MGGRREAVLRSLTALDPSRPRPPVIDVLAAPENGHLLDYVALDPFGAHVFPGDRPGYPPGSFLDDLDAQLAGSRAIHLWAYIPTCSYRCRFCQYPVVLVPAAPPEAAARADHWVDLNLREARLWLDRVPRLREVPVGEFNVFGGTPSLMSLGALARLLDFYRSAFAFGPGTAIRFEGDPTTLTEPFLEHLRAQGCTKLSCGVQSFDDRVLRLAGRAHTRTECLAFLDGARRVGFDRVSIDLMFGLLDQSVDSVVRDLDIVLDRGVPAVVCTKLHLRPFGETRTGVAGERPAPWELPGYRDRLARRGHHWPSLGEQYQMREVLATGLTAAGYDEHPTTYFHRAGLGPETWKALMVDQDRQEAEVAIGLGGSSSCRASEAVAEVDPARYAEAVEAGRLPLASATGFGDLAREGRAIRMALSALRPLRDDLHRERFGGRSLFDHPWGDVLAGLERRGLLSVDRGTGTLALTPTGAVLVEAIINTEF